MSGPLQGASTLQSVFDINDPKVTFLAIVYNNLQQLTSTIQFLK